MKRLVAILVASAAAAVAAYALMVRPWHLRWGTREDEAARPLPGDDLVPHPQLNATHAVTIHAPIANVWQWLVQMGQGRGGFYSYDWIDNLMSLDMRSADHILPEFQNLKVGDKMPLAPDGFGPVVAVLEPPRALVLYGDTRLDPDAIPVMKAGDFFAVTWGWYLEEIDANTTRLVERWRCDWNSSVANFFFMRAFLEPGAFLMERGMLLGVKRRAEKQPA